MGHFVDLNKLVSGLLKGLQGDPNALVPGDKLHNQKILGQELWVGTEMFDHEGLLAHFPQALTLRRKDFNRPEPPIIRVNPGFLEQPLEFQEAIVSHEMGHVALKHADDTIIHNMHERMMREIYIGAGSVQPRELDADIYGAQLIGAQRFLKAWDKFIDMAFVCRVSPVTTAEIITRRDILHKLFEQGKIK